MAELNHAITFRVMPISVTETAVTTVAGAQGRSRQVSIIASMN
jgi:hypothetical protein